MLVKQRECSTMPGDVKSAFYVRGGGGRVTSSPQALSCRSCLPSGRAVFEMLPPPVAEDLYLQVYFGCLQLL